MLLLLIIFVFILGYFYYCFWYQKHIKNGPPLYPGWVPILGHVNLLFGDNKQLWKNISKLSEFTTKQGGVSMFFIGIKKFYVITDPDDFITAGTYCLRKHALYSFFKPWVGDGIITTLHLSIWKRHRKLLSPSLKQQVLDTFIERFNINSNKLVEDFSLHLDKGPFCHTKYLERRSLETICQTGLSFKEDDYLFNKEEYFKTLSKILDIVVDRAKKIYQHNNFLFSISKDGSDLKKCVHFMNNISNEVIKKKRENLSNDGSDSTERRLKPFMDLAIDYMEEGVLTKQEVLDEVNTIIAAGYETSATAMTYIMLCLGTYKHVQDKVYEEIQAVFEGSMRDVEKADLAKLIYTEAVIKESMRLYTIVPLILRYLDTNVKLKNYTMEAGSSVVMMVNGIHRHPIWGADVHQFRPERWLETNDMESALYKAYAPFGVGKRLCIGRTYSYMSMKITLANVLRRYKITADINKVELSMLGVLKPVVNNEIIVELR